MSRRASSVPGARLYESSPLARCRYDAGLTREQLATELGISLRTLQRIETGHSLPRPDLAQKLAARFGVTAADLFLEPSS
jgi:DNA-binding XRE family transcriptional regulator